MGDLSYKSQPLIYGGGPSKELWMSLTKILWVGFSQLQNLIVMEEDEAQDQVSAQLSHTKAIHHKVRPCIRNSDLLRQKAHHAETNRKNWRQLFLSEVLPSWKRSQIN
jgi:hypothetical protein